MNNAIDKKVIPAVAGARAGHATRLLDLRALISLALQRDAFDALTYSTRHRRSEGGESWR